MLHRRDLVDHFLAFAREIQQHRAAIRAGRPAAAAAAGSGAEATESLPAFLNEDVLALSAMHAPAGFAARPGIGGVGGTPTLSLEPDAEIVIRRLQDFLEVQAAQVARTGTELMISQYREAQYAMAALADDLFIHDVEWNGREVWRSALLEQALFRTRLAGERVFDRMEALLASNDRRLSQLAAVYLLLLGLGFKGRYREPGGAVQLRSISARLFEFIAGRESELAPGLLPAGRTLIPSAYAHTMTDGQMRTLARGVRWPVVLAALAGAWLVVGQAMWWVTTANLSSAADAVMQASVRVTR
ncbi:DotU family type IV/VI secretion system protein [Azospirillum melinis]|uniref:DotU family type IV/VI secretion system protein n=1 Tax=Azospirillum melinis TaxID=328839 RepID=UPI003758406D